MMLKPLAIILYVAALAGAPGCTKKPSKGQPGVETQALGASSVKGAARGFVEASARRDRASVIRLLMNDSVCEAKPDKAAACRKYVKALRDGVPEMLRGVSKDFKVVRVEVKDLPTAGDKRVKLALVYSKGGGDPLPLMVIEYRRRFYVGLGVKTEDSDPRNSDPRNSDPRNSASQRTPKAARKGVAKSMKK